MIDVWIWGYLIFLYKIKVLWVFCVINYVICLGIILMKNKAITIRVVFIHNDVYKYLWIM